MREQPFAAKSCILAVLLMCACLAGTAFADPTVSIFVKDASESSRRYRRTCSS